VHHRTQKIDNFAASTIQKMKVRFLFVFMALVNICHAQETELPVYVTARPGYTWGAEVLEHHKLAWENGFLFETSPDGSKTLSLNSSILRYGLFQNTEVYIGTGLQITNDGQGWNFNEMGFSPMLFGTKIKCYNGEGLIPSVGVLAEFSSSHIGTKDLLPSHLTPRLYLLLDQSPTEWLTLWYNAGLEWDGESATQTTFLALGAWFSLTDRLDAFLESNNYFHPEGNQYLAAFGLTWLASRRVQLDLEADLDFKNLGGYYAIGFGVAWLVN
jgi:hypothetical protein